MGADGIPERRCVRDCGRLALDGHLTCGDVACDERGARDVHWRPGSGWARAERPGWAARLAGLARHRIRRVKSSELPPGVLAFVKEQATPQLLRKMLEHVDAGDMTADEFVTLVREWLKRGN